MTLDEMILNFKDEAKLKKIIFDTDKSDVCGTQNEAYYQLYRWLVELRHIKSSSIKVDGQYIDKATLIKAIEDEGADVVQDCGSYSEHGYSMKCLLSVIDGLPAIEDIRSVVTCKGCAFGEEEVIDGLDCIRCSNGRSGLLDTVNHRDFYCYNGRRIPMNDKDYQ